MKKLVLITVFAAVLMLLFACSNENPVLIEDENSIYSPDIAFESEPETEPEMEENPNTDPEKEAEHEESAKETEESAEAKNASFEKLINIYYKDTNGYAFDFGDYAGNIDTEKFTPIYQTVYDYSDFVEYQLFGAEIKNGKSFMELTEPTERFYIAYYEPEEESTMELYLEDGKYNFGMRFVDDKYKNFAIPKTEELLALSEKLDLEKTECRYVRIIGYASGILINDGMNEYFYVISTGSYAMGEFSEGELVAWEELAERMFD